jgi:hypothetical protein
MPSPGGGPASFARAASGADATWRDGGGCAHDGKNSAANNAITALAGTARS